MAQVRDASVSLMKLLRRRTLTEYQVPFRGRSAEKHRIRYLITSLMGYTWMTLPTRQVRRKGERSPQRQVYLIQSWRHVRGGTRLPSAAGAGVATTCWVRQYRVFTNATSLSRHEDRGRGWPHFCRGPSPNSRSLLSSLGLLTSPKYLQICGSGKRLLLVSKQVYLYIRKRR